MFNQIIRINPLPHIMFKGTANTLKKFSQICPHRNQSSNSAAYDGDGKTTVRILNDEEPHLNLVNTYSAKGFRLSNNLFISGSILLFPTNVYAWTVKRGIDITPESLLIFDLIVPKTKIVIIGYGQAGEPHDPQIPLILKKKGISCEFLPTPNAVTTYNYLVHDSVHVAGAFVPVIEHVKMTTNDTRALHEYSYMVEDTDYITQKPAPKLLDYVKAHKERKLRPDVTGKKFDP